MKLHVNREFAIRHLGVAALMVGLCGWFLYDGAVAYPQHDDAWFAERHTERARAIERQFQFAGLAGLAAIIIALGVLRVKRQTLGWNEIAMCGTLTGGRALLFSDVVRIDRSKWSSKGIMVLEAKDGRRVTLDAWHHAGVNSLVEEHFKDDAAQG